MSRWTLVRGALVSLAWLLLLLSSENARAAEHYRPTGEEIVTDIVLNRGKDKPRYSIRAQGKVLVNNEPMYRFGVGRFNDTDPAEEMFVAGKALSKPECYFLPIMAVVCFVPIGTEVAPHG